MTPLLPHTWPTVDGHVIKSLLSQNNCWLGSRVVVDLVVEGCTVVLVVVCLVVVVGNVVVVVVRVVVVGVVVVVWPWPQWPSEAISNEGFLHFATLNSQLWKYEIKQPVYVLNYPRKSITSNTSTTGNTQVGIECVTWKLTSWRSESRLIHTRSRLLQSAGRSRTPGQWSPGKSETERLYWSITKRRPGLEMKPGVPKTG